MASFSSSTNLPPSSSPSLVLTHPTPDERIQTWTLTHPHWGPALSQADYVAREQHLLTVPLAKDGGITHWVLTDADAPPDGQPRNVYASCETLRKRALVCGLETDGQVVEGVAHGVASVFTPEVFRRRGYASRMMKELGERLRRWDRAGEGSDETASDRAIDGEGGIQGASSKPRSLFSVLYSDIGKQFYARTGWAPFTSSHVEFPALQQDDSPEGQPPTHQLEASPITYSDLAPLCEADEAQLRTRLARQPNGPSRPNATDKHGARTTSVALIPDHDAILWHLRREEFVTRHLFHKSPEIKGAIYGSEPGARIWAVWTHMYYGGVGENGAANTLYFLRFVVEDAECSEQALVEGLRAVVQLARREATPWACKKVEMWNPEPKVKVAIEKSGLPHQFVDRDSESIASLLWYGSASPSDLDWVLNEKYGWC